MVKHVILWQLKDELSTEEKSAVKAGFKEGLESLSSKIPGLVDIHVNIDALPSSNADLMLVPPLRASRRSRATPPTRRMWQWQTARCALTTKTASVWTTRFNTGRLRTLRYAILWDELTQKGSLHGLCNDPFTIRRC